MLINEWAAKPVYPIAHYIVYIPRNNFPPRHLSKRQLSRNIVTDSQNTSDGEMFKKMTSTLLATAMLVVLVACMLPYRVSGYMHMSCVNHNLRLSLDDAIHISDVVLTGKIATMRNGIGTTKTATVTYYYAYKSDQHMRRRGFGRTEVENVMANASMGEATVFFLVREPSLILALQCMAPFTALRNTEFRGVVGALNRIQSVGKSESIFLFAACSFEGGAN